MVFDSLWGLFSTDLAIDLGTANTVVYVKGKGIEAGEVKHRAIPGIRERPVNGGALKEQKVRLDDFRSGRMPGAVQIHHVVGAEVRMQGGPGESEEVDGNEEGGCY